MQDELNAIRALNAADLEVTRLAKDLAAARALEPDAAALVSLAEAALADARAQLESTRKTERATRRDTEQYEQRRATALRALEAGIGDPDAAERQLAQVADILDDLETRQLELMELAETQEESVSAASQHLEAQRAALASVQGIAPERVRVAEEAHHQALAVRRDRTGALRPDLLEHYERVRTRKGVAMVSLTRDGSCPRCNTYPPAGALSDARRGAQLLVCSGCHRWLDPE